MSDSVTNENKNYPQDNNGLGTNELEQNLCSLYVGNVAFEAEESHFRELFAKFDPKDIRIKQEMTPTGNTRKFAFVNLSSIDQGRIAIAELDGTSFMGRVISLRLSRSGTNSGFDTERGTAKRSRGGNTALYKTQVCKFYNEGNCTFGNDCNFVHEQPGNAVNAIPRTNLANNFNDRTNNYHNIPTSDNNLNNTNYNSPNRYNNNNNNNNYHNNNLNNNMPNYNYNAPNNNNYNNNNSPNNNFNNYNAPNNNNYNNNNYNNNNNNNYNNNNYNNYNPNARLNANNVANSGYGGHQQGGHRGGYGMGRGGYGQSMRGHFSPRGPTGGKAENFRTVPCKLFLTGNCAYGDGCSFLHPTNNINNNSNNMKTSNDNSNVAIQNAYESSSIALY